MLRDWAANLLGDEVAEPVQSRGARIPKQGVLYLHVLQEPDGHQTQYQCADCAMWIRGIERCTIHGIEVTIRDIGTCGYWVRGEPKSPVNGARPQEHVTVEESGYEENEAGFSCKRCIHFHCSDCDIVDPNSIGDDPGSIHPNACCAAWQPGQDAARYEEAFEQVIDDEPKA